VPENDIVTAQALQKLRKSHGNERLKRKALRRLRKTDIEGAEVTCLGRLFQVQAAATEKARSPAVDSRVHQRRRGTRASPGPEISRVLKLIGEIRRCRRVQTLEQLAWTESSPVLSVSAVGAEWCGRT